MGEVYRGAEREVAVDREVSGSLWLSKSNSDLRCEDAIGHAICGCLSAAEYIEEFEETGGIEEAASLVAFAGVVGQSDDERRRLDI
jgi:hypothetical protein